MYTIFLDIDGTIYNGKFSDAVIAAIQKARFCGHKVFINTARHYHSLPSELYSIPLDGFVCSFGTTVFCDGDYLRRDLLSQQTAIECTEYAIKNNLQFSLIGEDIRFCYNYSKMPAIPLTSADELVLQYKNAQITKIAVHGTYSEDVYNFFRKYGEVYISGAYFEVVNKGFNKSSGIRLIEESYNIPHKNTVAIGDSMLDLDMINYANIGIAVNNERSELVKKAPYITKSLAEDGVAFAINCLLNGDLSYLKNNIFE